MKLNTLLNAICSMDITDVELIRKKDYMRFGLEWDNYDNVYRLGDETIFTEDELGEMEMESISPARDGSGVKVVLYW